MVNCCKCKGRFNISEVVFYHTYFCLPCFDKMWRVFYQKQKGGVIVPIPPTTKVVGILGTIL
jgi:hypothetical protein